MGLQPKTQREFHHEAAHHEKVCRFVDTVLSKTPDFHQKIANFVGQTVTPYGLGESPGKLALAARERSANFRLRRDDWPLEAADS